jgi:arabinoxylan arabinofuranohydrolase
MKDKFIALLPAIMALAGARCLADNPMVQTMYSADPAPMAHNGVLYAYLDHDEDTARGWFNMKDWRCFSTTDMANWTDLGVVASLKTFAWGKTDAWAGQVVPRNGKFYYYVPIRLSGDKFGVGVGVADKPEGPFTDAIGKPLIEGNGYIDPTVFVDDDGQAYLFCGNPKLYTVKINADMISTAGEVTQVPTTGATFKNQYLEGPWFYKRDNMYYMLFSSQNNGTRGKEDIRYSTAASPAGPWTFQGCIQPVQANGKSWTNHCGVVDYKGNSYFFYHNGDLPGGSDFTRSVGVEQFKYNADGTIPEIPMTKAGPAQIGTLNPFGRVEAETICFSSGVKTEPCSAGGLDVCKIKNGSYIKVKGVDFAKGAKSFTASVASETKGGKIEIYLDSLTTGTLVGTCEVPPTGGAQKWEAKSCSIKDAVGAHDVYFKFTGADGLLFNFDWWKCE